VVDSLTEAGRLARGLVAGAALFAASGAAAQTEIQWWHAMTGANNDVIVKLANDFNASQKDYKVVPSYKGGYPTP
jgi:sn-glycerol 3-phosphate transport system substrate-binding protein